MYLLDFQKKYGLEDFNLKQIDKYLWQLGKEKFSKNYGKGKKLESTTNEIEKAETRTRVIERKLANVEALPESE